MNVEIKLFLVSMLFFENFLSIADTYQGNCLHRSKILVASTNTHTHKCMRVSSFYLETYVALNQNKY